MGRHSKIFKQNRTDKIWRKRFLIKLFQFLKNMRFENQIYKFEQPYAYLPSRIAEEDLQFNFPEPYSMSEPKRADAAKYIHKKKLKSSGFWKSFSGILCCCCHILEAFN